MNSISFHGLCLPRSIISVGGIVPRKWRKHNKSSQHDAWYVFIHDQSPKFRTAIVCY